MIAITIKDVKIWINQKTILTPAEKAQATIRRKFGAYCRTIMKNSIKGASRLGQHSQPGQPPLHHHGQINYKETIFFVDDPKKKEVVIGAVLLSGTGAGGQPLPGILEHGGVMVPTGRMARFQRKPMEIAARPHSLPAFNKALKKKLPDLIKGGVMREV